MGSFEYDTIIIGSGVAGLAFANYSLDANYKQKILIIEKDNTIGGCHKVNRKPYKDEYYFCEHGPRVYINNYINFIMLLKSMNLNFYELFSKSYSLFEVSNKFLIEAKIFSLTELFYIVRDFIFVIFVNNHGIDFSMENYMNTNNFSQETKNKIDLMCRSFDGGGSDRISLNQFINITIQTLLYSVYIPKIPNDEGLFKYWRKYLEINNVNFIINNGVKEIIENKNKIEKVILNNGDEIYGKKFIFAIPPENLTNLLEKSKLKNSFGNFDELKEYTNITKYEEYISITFHWDSPLNNLINDVDVFNIKTEWGLIISNLSAFMKFKESKSKTVISCGVIYTNKKSSNINKTANECKDEEELMKEIFRQLSYIYKNIPEPTLYFINNYYDNVENKWKSNEKSYIKVPNYDYIKFQSPKYNNLYTLGTHNGKHKNSFTSIESAISNSIKLANIIYNKTNRIKRCFDLRDLIIVILSVIILLLIIRYNYYG
jgi:hypothetical protein